MKSRAVFETTVRAVTGALLPLALVVPAAGQATSRVSVDSAGAQGDGDCSEPAVSADGRYVAFKSYATNLVPGDTNATEDVFVHDRQSGTTERVSVDSAGAEGDFGGAVPTLSADGRYVTFVSSSSNLVPGTTNGWYQIYLHDRQTGTTERVSVDSGGAEGNDNSTGYTPISDDGRYVAFGSTASNLVPGDTNGFGDIFVHDRQTGATERVSVSTGGTQTNNQSFSVSMSSDGRYVAFRSNASNLVAGDTNAVGDIFVRDRQLGTTERVSRSTAGVQGNASSEGPSITEDGRYVAFRSAASTLVLGDTNAANDTFVHDRQTGTTERVSLSTGGAQGNNFSGGYPDISSDGRFVSFGASASNLVAGDTNATWDVFVRDRQLGTTERVSVSSTGVQGNNASQPSGQQNAISSDGRFVVFESEATNLVSGDTNGFHDMFIRDRQVPTFASLCFPGVDGVIACPCGQPANPAGGCANFGAGSTSGAVLSAGGVASVSADSVSLATSNHRSPAIGVLNVFFSFKPGTVTTGAASGAGVRCTSGGDLRRLYTMQVFGGSGSKPGMGDPSVSARSASFPGHAIAAPETRYYFNTYRDGQAAGPCGSTAVSTNVTNMGSISWSP
ncbi:MAG: TolB family protein [Planctomycetota bacterium]